TLTPTTSEATTTFPLLLDFSYVLKFNDRVTNLEKGLSKIKQVDQYAQALFTIPTIVDRYIDNKLREAIQKAILAHNLDCREEAQAEKRDYIELVDTSMRAILKEEVKLNFLRFSLKSSSQPKSTYKAAASLFEFELTKILIDKMDKNKSYDKADYKRELYDALVKSYQTDKDLFDTYGEVFMLKRSRDDKDKDQDPSDGSDRWMKRKKSSKEAESSRDSRSKEKKYSSTSKDASHSQHNPSGKSAHAEEPSHRVDDSREQQNQEFDTGNNDEQPADKERQHVDFRPPQTWISQVSCAKEPTTSFDELLNTQIDFSAFVLNRLNIKYLTQAILVGPAFDLLKGTCKSLTELEFHLEECSKATTEQLDWHNPEGKPYLFDLSKPLPLIPNHRGRQTKDATYEIKWFEDLVSNLWSPVKVIIIQRLVEDLQLGVESYQKKLNLTKTNTFRLNLRNRTAYNAYSDPKGVIYKDQNNINRLMHADELHKFSDGTLNDVRTALHDIAMGIRMEYLPKRKWSRLDKRRARVMIQDIEK
ncbi:hypothetical protein Tco_1475068, partial [Tanacetum coccineum]